MADPGAPTEPGRDDGDRSRRLPTVRQMAAAVGVPRLELVVERESTRQTERIVVLDGDLFRLGSHPSNDLVLDDPLVSRFHCQLTRTDSGWVISDTGSLNGTDVSGVRVRDADLPLPSCHIQLGGSLVRVRELGVTAIASVPTSSSFGDLHGESLVMRRLFGVLEKVGQSESTVLIEGESGTGKELAATEVVRRGPRADKPFLIVDCGAISPNLIESELFGHARGAFTGADRTRVGAFEAADGGTILLDEIGELPLDMQPKLLRAIETREIRRIGENTARRVNVRVIAATNRRLEREVNRGRFREDLFFRLSVVTLRIPALRKRLEDIPLLVRTLLDQMNVRDAGHLFTPAVLADMSRYDWPGNVRELRNYIERSVVLDHTVPASERHSAQSLLPSPGSTAAPPAARAGVATPAPIDASVPFRNAKERVVSDFERRYLEALLAACDGNVSRAARQAQMDRMHLHKLLQRYGLRGK
jgi:DNA-binding NtrC family response regulator